MKVLLIAYACEPNKGSEPGVGWNWSIHLSKYVNVTVITRSNNRQIIEKELNKKKYDNLSFIYFDIPIFSKIKKILPFGVQLYYLFWEYLVINKIKGDKKYDVIQRVTFVSITTLLRLYKLNKPYILSFCAGGELTPRNIFDKYNYIDKFKEILRLNYNSAYKYSYITRKIYNKCELVIVVTEESKRFLENLNIKKEIEIIIEPAIGLNICNEITLSKGIKNKLIYAGSIIWLKNVDIIIKAINFVKSDIKLDIYGSGNKEKLMKKIADKLNLNNKINFNGTIAHNKLLSIYKNYDLAIHASSHDSGSMFLLEAISAGIPVLILNTGGPKEIFNGTDYPLRVNPAQSYDEIIREFAKKVDWFYQNYEDFMKEFINYREHVIQKYLWDNKAKRMVEIYKEVLNENITNS